jgi:MinD-like ATPase involved in chromosome partitioning or flagellar assembly
VVTFHDDCSALENDVEQMEPDVVVLSPQSRNYSNALVDRLRRRPDFMVVVVGLVPPQGDWGAEMKAAGAAGFLRTPVNSATIDRFLASPPKWISEAASERSSPAFLYDLKPEAARAMAAQGYRRGVYASWSPKGGAGKTTLACNTAVLLGVLCQRPTLLIDANMSGGHVWLHMGLRPKTNVYSLARAYQANGNHLTPRDLSDQVVPYGQALDVLPGIMRVEQAGSDVLRGECGERFMDALLTLAERQYDFVIVDLGSSPNVTVHLTVLRESDRVLVVATPDRTALVDAKNTIETLQNAMGISRDHFWLVINMYTEESGLSRKQIPSWIELAEMGLIPLDPGGRVMKTTNTGVPFVMEHMKEKDPAPDVAAVLEGFAGVAMNIYPPFRPVWEDRHQRMRERRGGALGSLFQRVMKSPI